MHNNFRILTLVVALIFLAFMTVSVLGARPVLAQTPFLPFGGPLMAITACNTGFLVVIGPPVGGSFMFVLSPLPPIGYVLGLASFVPIPCTVGSSVVGMGFPVILFGH